MDPIAFLIKLTMLAAVSSFILDVERERAKPAPSVDGFHPVNRRLVDMALRQL